MQVLEESSGLQPSAAGKCSLHVSKKFQRHWGWSLLLPGLPVPPSPAGSALGLGVGLQEASLGPWGPTPPNPITGGALLPWLAGALCQNPSWQPLLAASLTLSCRSWCWPRPQLGTDGPF